MISYYSKVTSKAATLTPEILEKLATSDEVRKICEQTVRTEDHDKLSSLKRQLPAITWQAWQPDGSQRSNKMSEPNGLFIIDIDHAAVPQGLWADISAKLPQWKNDKVYCAHITPSGKGLRLVCRRYNSVLSIAECQQIFCSHYNLQNDPAVKDLARTSFLVSKDMFLYLDNDIFYDHWQGMTLDTTPTIEAPAAAPAAQPNLKPVAGDFRGVPLQTIVDEVIARTGGVPVEGERNTRLYEVARILRYIVDFSASRLASILPSFGLPVSEVEQVAQSAVKSNRAERIPDILRSVLREYADEDDGTSEVDTASDANSEIREIEKYLPPVFKELVSIAPEDFKASVCIALLPILGTLSSTARGRYLDGTLHSPSFISVVSAPQASGKSFARALVRRCMKPLDEADKAARIQEQMYSKALREAKNSKQQPKEPETMVRCVPASISVAKLLKRLDKSRGLHLFTFCEEIDTVYKSNRSGAWAQKSDIYRNAFDNAVYGQDYMTDVSYSATVEVFYNLLLLGTPNAVGRFFNDPEDGLVSRVCFTLIPDQFGADMPTWKVLSSTQSQSIDMVCRNLMKFFSTPENKHQYDLSYVNDALRVWLGKERDKAIQSLSRARDTCRRRAAVVGFRAALLAVAIYDAIKQEPKKEDIIAFAIHISNYYLKTMMSMYGEAMEKALSPNNNHSGRVMAAAVFDSLSDTFTRNDLLVKLKKAHYSSPIKAVLYIWKKRGFITIDGETIKKKK